MPDRKVKWKLSGMSCASCASRIETYLKKEGMEDIWVDFSSGEVIFTADESKGISFDRLAKGLLQMGYRVLDAEKEGKPFLNLNNKLIISALFTFPLLLAHLAMVAGLHQLHLPPFWQFILAAPVMFIGIIHFGKSAWMAVKQGDTNMDVLIFGGSFIAFLYSIAGLYLQDASMVYFEASASIITLVLLGNYLERRSLRKASEEIRKLEESLPEKVRIIVEGRDEKEIPADRIESGMRVLLAAGDAVPADGVLGEGRMLVNEALITGESVPVKKEKGDELTAGTIVMEGHGQMSVLRTGGGTYLARLMQMVRRSQSEKPPIHRLSDKVSRIFIPAVLLIALFTFLGNYYIWDIDLSSSMLRAVAVLVIACPCAMGLATPAAVMVGTGAAVRRGIVFKEGTAFEALPSIKNVVFDKTGTLTEGVFDVMLGNKGEKDGRWMPYVLAMERRSTHPIARSIARHLSEEFPGMEAAKLKKVREIKGVGMEALDKSGNKYELKGASNGEDAKKIVLQQNGEVVYEFEVGDRLKEGAKEVVDRLKSSGRRLVIISGDREEITARVARELGVEEYYSEKLPEEKLQLVRQIKAEGKTAVLGDGINDAAAIALADVGFAFSGTSLMSVDSASIVLIRSGLDSLTSAFKISEYTFRTIRENLFWAFSYNIIAIPMAAIGLLNPIAAAAFMAFSDLVVVGNALRLKWKFSRLKK